MPFSVLISGIGSIGSRHARNLRTLNTDQLIVCDPDHEKISALCKELNCEGYGDFSQALAKGKPDVVFICSPTSLHLPQAILAARAGCNLFIEKPLSHSMEGIDELERISSKNNLVTMVGCNMRFHPGPKKIKELLQEGCIGTPLSARLQTGSYLPRWRPDREYRKSYSASLEEGGAILDCIHEIDLALWYFGKATLLHAVSLPARSLGLSVEGLAELLLQHVSGTLTSLNLNFVQRDERRFCQIFGTLGSLYWDMERKQVDHYGEDGKCVSSLPVEPPHFTLNQMYIDEIRHFLDSVATQTETHCPVSAAREILEIALNARHDVLQPLSV